MAAVARRLRQEFMPWQEQVALVAGEMVRDEDTGIWVPAYPEVFVTVPRQNGKTVILLSWHVDRAVAWEPYDGKPQAIAYTAQSGSDARKKFKKEHLPQLRSTSVWSLIRKERLSAEDTGLDYKNGSTYTIWATSESAGHGSTVDLVEMDEIFDDEDDRREQAAIPATATRHDSQKLMSSTAGTEKSVLYLRKQAAGRASVMEDRREGIAYFEWSADPKADPEDPETWRSCMPALGYTITERTVRAALDQMRKEDGDLTEFSRAWLNITKRTGGERVIPEAMWNSVLRNAQLSGRMVVAVDATIDGSSASIAVASEAGVVEVHRHDDGTSWLLDELETAWKTLKTPVVVDKGGPVAHLIPQLEARNVTVIEFGSTDVARSCALIYERIADRRIHVRPVGCDHCGKVPITAAVEGAIRQPLGDGWKWSRKSTDVDISPLMAASLAVGAISGVGVDAGRSSVPFAFA